MKERLSKIIQQDDAQDGEKAEVEVKVKKHFSVPQSWTDAVLKLHAEGPQQPQEEDAPPAPKVLN